MDPEPLRKLSEITGNYAYEDHEVAFEDDFVHPYIGKEYGGRASEVLTMGLQGIFYPSYARPPGPRPGHAPLHPRPAGGGVNFTFTGSYLGHPVTGTVADGVLTAPVIADRVRRMIVHGVRVPVANMSGPATLEGWLAVGDDRLRAGPGHRSLRRPAEDGAGATAPGGRTGRGVGRREGAREGRRRSRTASAAGTTPAGSSPSWRSRRSAPAAARPTRPGSARRARPRRTPCSGRTARRSSATRSRPTCARPRRRSARRRGSRPATRSATCPRTASRWPTRA